MISLILVCIACLGFFWQAISVQNLRRSTTTVVVQGEHRLEKYLNLEGFLEQSLKIKSALKNTGKSLKGLEKSLILLYSVCLRTVDRDLNQYKIVRLYLVLHQIKAQRSDTNSLVLMSPLSQICIFHKL